MSSTTTQRAVSAASTGLVSVLLFSFAVSASWAASSDVGPAPAASRKTTLPAPVRNPRAAKRQPDSGQEIARYSDVLAKNPNNAAALIGRGKAYVSRRDYAAAFADYDHAAQLAPQWKAARYGREAARFLLQEHAAHSLAAAKPARTQSASVLNGSQFDDDGTIRSDVPSPTPTLARN